MQCNYFLGLPPSKNTLVPTTCGPDTSLSFSLLVSCFEPVVLWPLHMVMDQNVLEALSQQVLSLHHSLDK